MYLDIFPWPAGEIERQWIIISKSTKFLTNILQLLRIKSDETIPFTLVGEWIFLIETMARKTVSLGGIYLIAERDFSKWSFYLGRRNATLK